MHVNLSIARPELLHEAELGDEVSFLREEVRVLGGALTELEFTSQTAVERHERPVERREKRSAQPDRTRKTRVGTISLRVPLLCPEESCPTVSAWNAGPTPLSWK